MIVGYDAKRIVRNATGLGSYGRTLVNDLSRQEGVDLHLYAPDEGRDDLRSQILPGVHWHFAHTAPLELRSLATERQRVGASAGNREALATDRDARMGTQVIGFAAIPALRAPTRSLSLVEECTQRLAASLWRTRGIVKDLQRDGIMLYHGLSGELPVGIRKSGIKSVVTIHDLIFLRHPEYYHWLDTKMYAWKFRHTIREADHIIAISECTKRDIIEFGGIDARRISVIYQSCAPRFTHGVSSEVQSCHSSMVPPCIKRYILNVGSIEERKNILLAVKALHHLPEDLGLVIVGRHTKYTDRVEAYVRQNGLSGRVRILHGITDDLLPALYAGAEAFVYPSRYEGFGIPVIEAIGCGLPVVACTGSCLEEAGGPDSLYVPPDDVPGMAAAIGRVLRGAEGREQRICRSREYIRRFDGSGVAGQVVDLYRSLLQ